MSTFPRIEPASDIAFIHPVTGARYLSLSITQVRSLIDRGKFHAFTDWASERHYKSAYSPFERAVAYHCSGLTVAVGCRGAECEHADGDSEHYCEPSFSQSQCDSCGSTLHGDREPATGIPRDFRPGEGESRFIELSICVDCVLYHANGDLPETWH